MASDRLERAVLNNALWCSEVCRTHGSAGTFTQQCWLHEGTAPRFYPNAVTLRRDRGSVMDELTSLLEARGDARWSIKDSFADIDLSAFNGSVLFEAQWFWCEAVEATGSQMHAHRVNSARELVEWEDAWRRANHVPGLDRVFLPELLAVHEVAVLYWGAATAMTGGVIAYCGADVVSVSNVFAADRTLAAGELFAAAARVFPDLPLVGYASVLPAHPGVTPLGRLNVWVKRSA